MAAVSFASCSKPKADVENADGANAPATSTEVSPPPAVAAEVPIGKLIDWQAEVDNPRRDGWDSEVSAAEAKAQLKKFGELLISAGPADRAAIAKLVVEPFLSSGTLSPISERVFEDTVTIVQRRRAGEDSGAVIRGVREFADTIDAAEFSRDGASQHRAEFKIFKILLGEDGFSTHQYVSLSWKTEEAIFEQHATWVIKWKTGGQASLPKIQQIEAIDFEQVQTKIAGGRPMFSDCTESVLGANASYREQLLYGLTHWHERLPYRKTLNGIGTPGLALGDVNGDGLDDLYLCQHPGLPNLLFLQNADGTLRDVSADWGVDWLEDSRSALIVDLDNDGDQDLAIAILGHLILLSNQENKKFQIELVLPVSESTASIAAADYDRDGRIDLYVCGYAPETTSAQAAASAASALGTDGFVYHDANNSVANVLFHNESTSAGGWKFSDVTQACGLDVNNRRWSFAAVWEDYDNDGDVDLYVANDYGRNNLYRNDGAKFVDVAGPLGVEDSASGMSVSWGDYDRDGRMDLYVANMFSAAGNRITSLSKFKPSISGDLRRRFQRFARGNTLMRNHGEDGFSDVSLAAGVSVGRWAWSSIFADLNNDGWEDLVVANGYISSADDTGDL